MQTVSDYLKYANLQMAAEAVYQFDANKPGVRLPGQVAPYDDSAVIQSYLTTGNLHSSKFTTTEAIKFASEWTVVEHKSNTTTGFSGTLFRNNATRELVMSFRSTEFLDDAARDNTATNVLEIKEKGWAFGQISDMEQWYQSLLSKIDAPLSVTGYSLGGHLATAFNLLHPGAAQEVITFNGAGVGKIGTADGSLASTQQQLGQMIARFQALRTQGDTTGFLDRFQSTEGREAYLAIKAELANTNGVPGDTVSGLFNSRLTNLANSVRPTMPDEPNYAARLDDYGLLYEAVSRIKEVFSYAHYAPSLNSGSDQGPANPANIQDLYTKSDGGRALAIAGESLDYQIAVLTAATEFNTSSLSFLGGLEATFGGRKMGDGVGAGLANQWDVAGIETSVDSPRFMVSHSQYRYGQEQQIFIEDQPLSRGAATGSFIAPSNLFGNFAIRLLFDGYDKKDFGDTHSLVLLVDSLNLQNTLLQLAPNTTQETLNAILKNASNLRRVNGDTLFGAGQGKAEGDVLENTLNALGILLLGPDAWNALRGDPEGNTWARMGNLARADSEQGNVIYAGRESFYQGLDVLQKSALFTALKDKLSLGIPNATAIKENARNDFAAFTALHALSPFIASLSSGSLEDTVKSAWGAAYDEWKADQSLSEADRTAGKAVYSDTWYSDRGAFFDYWLKSTEQNVQVLQNASAGLNATDQLVFKQLDSGQKITVQNNVADSGQLTEKESLYVLFGSKGMDILQGGKLADHLYGMSGNDILQGKGSDDLLEGGKDNDLLIGGNGTDTLNGGQGFDTYVWANDPGKSFLGITIGASNDGDDRIIDADKNGRLLINGSAAKLLVQKTPTTWVSHDGKLTLTQPADSSSGWKLDIAGGGSLDLGSSFNDGDYGLYRQDVAPVLPTDPTIVGDRSLKEFTANFTGMIDYNKFGPGWYNSRITVTAEHADPEDATKSIVDAYQVTYNTKNALDNFITEGSGSAPDRNDTLNGDATQADYIQGFGGNDEIDAKGGNDRIQAGTGDDLVSAGAGHDLVEGGSGADRLLGGDGRDTLWGDTTATGSTPIASAITSGETDSSQNSKGDWLDGGTGDDILIGSAANDVLVAGAENDLLIGGAGDDLLLGDGIGQINPAADWSTGRQVRTDPDTKITSYTATFSGSSATWFTQFGGADMLYGGAGDDWVFAGAGDDQVDGGKGKDVLFGEAGNDVVLGGLDDDLIIGDSSGLAENLQGHDWLDGGEGKDTLEGMGGDDVLIGGRGDDTLMGGKGRDTYIYNQGDGVDTVIDDDTGAEKSILVFGEGVSKDAIKLRKGSLLLDLGNGDGVHIENFNADDPLGTQSIGSFNFADGFTLSWGELLARGFDLDGTEEDDSITGTGTEDRIDGKGGNDVLSGLAGNDVLTGGSGTDRLLGGLGDDVYVFQAGNGELFTDADGNIIVETVRDEGGIDTVRLDVSIDPTTIRLVATTGNELVIDYGSSDEVGIVDGKAGAVERFEVTRLGANGVSVTENLAYTQFVGRFGDGVFTGVDAQGYVHWSGGKTSDTLFTATDYSVVSGGRGDDHLSVYGMESTIEYSVGDGRDRVQTSGSAGANNTLRLYGVNPDGLRLGLTSVGTLTIGIGAGAADLIELESVNPADVFAAPPIDRIEFVGADGAVDPLNTLDYADLMAKGFDIEGTADVDGLVGTDVTDRIVAGAGDDQLWGYKGDDVLAGGSGNDMLMGGAGDDSYAFNLGDGKDSILDGEGSNAVIFGTGLSTTTLAVSQAVGDDGSRYLDLDFGNGDRLSILDGELDKVQSFAFADGTLMTSAGLLAMLPQVDLFGGDTAETLQGYGGDDLIAGNGGDDVLRGGEGEDQLAGGEGADSLDGGIGDDLLDGGVGDDLLVGGAGMDRYVFLPGSGRDTIVEAGGEASVLRLGPGATALTLKPFREGDDLVLRHANQNDSLRISGYYAQVDAGTNWQVVADDGNVKGMTTFLADAMVTAGSVARVVASYEDGVKAEWAAIVQQQGYSWQADGTWRLRSTTIDGTETEHYVRSTDWSRQFALNSIVADASGGWTNYSLPSSEWGITEMTTVETANGRLASFAEHEPLRTAGGTQPYFVRATRKSGSFQVPAGGMVTPVYQKLPEGTPARILPGDSYDPSSYGSPMTGRLLGWWVTPIPSGGSGGGAGASGAQSITTTITRSTGTIADSVPIWTLSGSDDTLAAFGYAVVDGGAGNDWLSAGAYGGEVAGVSDVWGIGRLGSLLYGNDGDDWLTATAGYYNAAGDNMLIGGRGRDVLIGGNGADTFMLLEEDSVDYVTDLGFSADDVLVFDVGVAPESVSVFMSDSPPENQGPWYEPVLQIMTADGTGAQVTLARVDEAAGAGIDYVQFGDGARVSMAGMVARLDLDQSVHGSNRADIIRTGSGDDTIEGGAGDDTIVGGTGSDTYVFGLGDGQDTIVLSDGGIGLDTIQFKAGVVAAEAVVTRDGAGLHFSIGNGSDSITVTNLEVGALTAVKFADGTVWDSDQIDSFGQFIVGTDSNDWLFGTDNNDRILGAGGDDSLFGWNGNDTLDGGAGDDNLSGGLGDDVYVFDRGNGNDFIRNEEGGLSGHDQIQIGSNLTLADLKILSDGPSCFEITINDTGETLTVFGDRYLEQFAPVLRFSDDSRFELGDELVGTDDDDELHGTFANDELVGLGDGDWLYGYAGNDLLIGGVGNDYLNGGYGDDVFEFGLGDGIDEIDQYNGGHADHDVIQLAPGISQADISIGNSEGDIRIAIGNIGDQLTVTGDVYESVAPILRFADGSEMSLGIRMIGNSRGNDLYGTFGADSISGGRGDDEIYGFAGNDVLDGGLGDDWLSGGSGSDAFLFGRGYGHDDFDFWDWNWDDHDVILLSGDIAPGDVSLLRTEYDFYFVLIDGGRDSIRVNADPDSFPTLRFGDGTEWSRAEFQSASYGVVGNSYDDWLDGSDFSETLLGMDGDDTLWGSIGDDMLDGGAGNDRIGDGPGDDVIVFGRGSGDDILDRADSAPSDLDEIRLSADVKPSDISVFQQDARFVLRINDTGETMTILADLAQQVIPNVRFADGTILDSSIWNSTVAATIGTPTDDELDGTGADDTILALSGADVIYGGDGDDWIDGGRGVDTILGGAGNDTYVWGRGSGNDVIDQDDADMGDQDVILVAGNLLPSDVGVYRNGSTGILVTKDTSDTLRLDLTADVVPTIRFQDGTQWNATVFVGAPTAIVGDDDHNYLWAEDGGSLILGLGGDDSLSSESGGNILVGGQGNDWISLNGEGDSAVFYRGDGSDRVSFWGSGPEGAIRFGAGIDPEGIMVTATFDGEDVGVLLSLAGGNDSIELRGPLGRLPKVVFADGTQWTGASVLDQVINIEGTGADDILIGGIGDDYIDAGGGEDVIFDFAGNNTLIGGEGNDGLSGGDGNDSLAGGSGDDWLSGSAGDDTLSGGSGYDEMNGGEGSDVYLFGRGDGEDRIYNWRESDSDHDVIRLGMGIDPDDVWFAISGRSFELAVIGTEDRLHINASPYDLPEVEFANGATWNTATLLSMVSNTVGTSDGELLIGTADDDYIDGAGGYDAIYGLDGNDSLHSGIGYAEIYGGAGNDLLDASGGGSLYGEAGNDTLLGGADYTGLSGGDGDDLLMAGAGGAGLEGGSGNDTLRGGAGSDWLSGGAGDDILAGGAGSDWYYVDDQSGQDRIVETVNLDDVNVIEFGWNLTPDQMQFARRDTDMAISFAGLDTRASVTGWFDPNLPARVQAFSFDRGDYWDESRIAAAMADFETGGGSGDDLLVERGGSHVFVGRGGNDELRGSGGGNVYAFNIGDGIDRIVDTSTVDGFSADNVIQFGSGVSAPVLEFETTATDLLIHYGATDSVLVTGYDGSENLQVRFSDGSQTSLARLVNTAPHPGQIAQVVSATQDQAFTYAVPGNLLVDTDIGEHLAYSVTLSDGSPLPTWLSFDATNLSFSGTPTNDEVGEVILKLTATDRFGLSDSQAVKILVADVNDAPVLVAPLADTAATQDAVFTYVIPPASFKDIDKHDSLVFTITRSDGTPLPAWLNFNPATLSLSGVPAASDSGQLSIVVTATDQGGLTASATFSLTVGRHLQGGGSSETLTGTAYNDLIDSGAGNDAVTAGDGADVIIGGSGSDNLYGGTGDDIFLLSGTDAGYDRFEGGAGFDVLRGSAGDDTFRMYQFTGAATVERIEGNGGNDQVAGTGSSDTLDFSATELVGISQIDGGAGNDAITGSAGADVIIGGTGSDNLYGGAGDDVFLLSGTDAGYDRFEGDAGVDILRGSAGDDTFRMYQFTVAATVERIEGNGGNDQVAGTGSSDTLDFSATELVGISQIDGGAGNDAITGSAVDDVIVGGTGSDNLNGGAGDDVFLLSGTDAGYDRFEGGAGFDVLRGSAGDDTFRMYQFTGTATVERIEGNGGNDQVAGTGSSDTLDFSATELVGISQIDGGAGNDAITGSAGADVIIGGSGSDNLYGGTGDDLFLLSGTDAGYDRFQGDAGYDILRGSAGDDTFRMYQFTGAATVERIEGNGGNDQVAGTGSSDTLDFSATELVGISQIDGGAGNDAITGSAGADVIIGGAGSDNLNGGAGDDVFLLSGTDAGYDRFEGGAGFDVLRGSAGDDTFRMYQFTGAATVERIEGNGGNDQVAGTGSSDTLDFSATELVGISQIDGGPGNDAITGSAGADVIIGGSGSDNLYGGAGDDIFLLSGTDAGYDRFQGDAGFDILRGSSGDDTFRMYQFTGAATVERIEGNGGNDQIAGTGSSDTLDFSATELVGISQIDGGAGNDAITGSAGADVIIGGTGADRLRGGAGSDIYRFGRGDGVDTIVENDATFGNVDAAEFAVGISADQIWLRRVGNSLEASLIGTTDKLSLENWYLGAAYHVEQFRTADGMTLIDSQVESLVQAMAAFAPPAAGQTTLPPVYQESLAPVIAANWH